MIYCYAGDLAAGTPATARNIIARAASSSALENVVIANRDKATVNAGVALYSGTGSTVENSYGTLGAQATGTIPVKNAPNPPLRLVPGPVTDASFTRQPPDGTMAVDSTDKRLYVRVGGTWLWSALNA